jgi:hypothetical protein
MGRRLLLSCCCLLWRVASVGTARGDGGGTARGDGGGTARGGGCNNCSGLRDINFGEGKIAHTPRVASAAACCASCRANTACKVWAYKDAGDCYLKDNARPLPSPHEPGMITGACGAALPSPPPPPPPPPPPSTDLRPKYGIGIYNDTARAPSQIEQVPVACNLTGPQGWVVLFFETLDGGRSLAPQPPAPPHAGCTGHAAGHKACACAMDGKAATLSCGPKGGTIAKVDFASIGTPAGQCGNLTIGKCHGDEAKARSFVQSSCVGKASCTLPADIGHWNGNKDPCYGTVKSVAVQVQCSGPTPAPLPTPAPPGPAPPPPPCAPEQWQIDALKAVMACGLRPIVRLGQRSRGYRYNADDHGYRSYKALGQRYADFTTSLLSGAGATDKASSITVLVGNEPNICVEWECWGTGSVNISTMAAEWAGYTEDVLAALSPLGVQLAASPLAPGGNSVCGCCTPGSDYWSVYCKGSVSGGSGMEDYLRDAIRERPGLFAKATYFAAHPYPAQEWDGLNSSANLPVELNGSATWWSEVKSLRYLVADSWASNASHDKAALINATAFRMIGTETGFGGRNEGAKASGMVELYTKLWNPDPVVAGIVPFLLAGQHWDSYGFTWSKFSAGKATTLQPIYTAIQALAKGSSGSGT